MYVSVTEVEISGSEFEQKLLRKQSLKINIVKYHIIIDQIKTLGGKMELPS